MPTIKSAPGQRLLPPLLLPTLLAAAALCCCPAPVRAQKRPKPALSESNARRAIAAAPGFELRTSAVRVLEVSGAGVSPVSVRAEVTVGFRFRRVKETPAGGPERQRWQAVEFRTADRNWEEMDFLAAALGAEAVAQARATLESLAEEFAALQGAQKKADPAGAASASGAPEDGGPASRQPEGGETEGGKPEGAPPGVPAPIKRGALTIKQFSALGSSAVAEMAVEADFRLERGAGGRWRAAEVTVGGVSSGDLGTLIASVDGQKAARARAELETVRAALEEFRRERGFYVVSDSEVVLMDHLNPSYIGRVVRIDPWHRPYRYAGTRDGFRLSSDGADGLASTADDVTLSGGPGGGRN